MSGDVQVDVMLSPSGGGQSGLHVQSCRANERVLRLTSLTEGPDAAERSDAADSAIIRYGCAESGRVSTFTPFDSFARSFDLSAELITAIAVKYARVHGINTTDKELNQLCGFDSPNCRCYPTCSSSAIVSL